MEFDGPAGSFRVAGDPTRITVGEVASACGVVGSPTIDGAPTDAGLTLAEAAPARGAVWASGRGASRPAPVPYELGQVAGPAAGAVVAVPARPLGLAALGPSVGELAWSVDGRAPAQATLDPTDPAPLVVGDAVFRCRPTPRPASAPVRPGPDGTVVVVPTAPDRPTAPTAPASPAPPEAPRAAPPPSWWAAVPAVGMAAVGWFVSPIMAALGAVAALVVAGRRLGSAVGGRRARARYRRDLGEHARRVEAAAVSHARAVADHAWSIAFLPDDLTRLVARGDAPAWSTDRPALPILVGGDPVRPALVDLDDGLGIVGPRSMALSLARWLVVARGATVGPAAERLVVACAPGRVADWAWCRWLPACAGVAVGTLEADRLLGDVGGPGTLVVVDGVDPVEAGPLANLLAGHGDASVLVVAAERVPAAARRVVAVEADGTAALDDLVGPVVGLGEDRARSSARGLARFTEPGRRVHGVDRLPDAVTLDRLHGAGAASLGAAAVEERWSSVRIDALPVPLGLDAEGPVVVDLVADGPHALVAGTTGSGKSELLRTLVLGAAIRTPPDRLRFVLVDFKGGGAFDLVAGLPHVGAVVTDLGPAEAERALRSLRAELRDREEILRRLGLSDLADAAGHELDLPARLVIVVDEFATLVDELGDFVDGLLDVARRGRSLGVHLVLATQRPAGVVSGAIRANTNLRIALRVQDVADSIDVLDDPAAARLPAIPGRAVVSAGGRRRTIQVARIGIPLDPDPIVTPFVAHPSFLPSTAPRAVAVQPLLDAVTEAARRTGAPVAEAPWCPPPPSAAALTASIEGGAVESGAVVLGLLDDPDRRRHVPLRWCPAREGLAVVGLEPGVVGTLTDALGLVRRSTWVLDGYGDLVGPVRPGAPAPIRPDRPDEVRALLRRLDGGGPDQATALVVHGWSAVADRLAEEPGGVELVHGLERLVRHGDRRAVAVAVTGRSDRDLPLRILGSLGRRIVGRLPDAVGYATFGLSSRAAVSIDGPGAVVDATSGLVGRLALGRVGVVLPVEEPLRVLGTVELADLGPVAVVGDRWSVPLGLDPELGEVRVLVGVGHPLLVAGPRGSGRTTALRLLEAAVPGLRVVDDADRLAADDLDEALSVDGPLAVAVAPDSLRALDRPFRSLARKGELIVLRPTPSERDLTGPVPSVSTPPPGRGVLVGRGWVQIARRAAAEEDRVAV